MVKKRRISCLAIDCYLTTLLAKDIFFECLRRWAGKVLLTMAGLGVWYGIVQAKSLDVADLQFRDLPPRLAQRFDPMSFTGLMRTLTERTERRKREGEFDHLIAYALQSNQFTKEPRIEPALSAKVYAQSATIPTEVQRRLQQFLQSLSNPADNPRLKYFAQLVPAHNRSLEFLEGEYSRVMKFLYAKEFLQQTHAYETRGYSTDTQVAVNFTVWNALSLLRAMNPGLRIRRVLIIGPGMDLAPRTELIDAVPPQSFQPYLTADALLSLELSALSDLEIDCVDISRRVVDLINSFSGGKRLLQLYSPRGTKEYNRYFELLGREIGKPSQDDTLSSALPRDFLIRFLSVKPRVAQAVHATELNISTQRLLQTYDLAIATNVLLYFEPAELALALGSTAAMLRTGGYLIHNDLRPETEAEAERAGLAVLQGRSVLVAEGRHAPLYDSFALHQKR